MNLLLCLKLHLIIGSKLWFVCPPENSNNLCLCHPRGWQKCLEDRQKCSQVTSKCRKCLSLKRIGIAHEFFRYESYRLLFGFILFSWCIDIINWFTVLNQKKNKSCIIHCMVHDLVVHKRNPTIDNKSHSDTQEPMFVPVFKPCPSVQEALALPLRYHSLA